MTDWQEWLGSSWQEWAGGSMPDGLDIDDRVYLRYRNGDESKIRIVGDLRWIHENLPDDIIAWRFSHHKDGTT